MKCFIFPIWDKKDEPKTSKSISTRSINSIFTDRELGRSGSELNSQNVSGISNESMGRSPIPSLSQRPSNLKVFTVSELKSATKNFSRSVMLGEGGFGCVYKGFIKDPDDSSQKIEVAVKQLESAWFHNNLICWNGTFLCKGHKEWVTEVNVLGVVEHQNLVKLVGYCAEDDERGIQRLLIYEYMPNRSVESHLSVRSETTLTWAMRLKIAQDAARGLAYLHEGMDFQIIFRDFKSSNILLDEHWNAKLSDFGLARLGPAEGLTHVSTAVMLSKLHSNKYFLSTHQSIYKHQTDGLEQVVGTMGYAAPEYIQTGRLTSKIDVWSYGVFLYELITGRRPLDKNRPKNEQKLLDWVKPYLSDSKKFQLILDPRLKGKYQSKAAQKLAIVANRCLVKNPKSRPKMSEVLEMVNKIVEASVVPGSPEPPLKSLKSMETSREPERKHKRRIIDFRGGEKFVRAWTPKLVRTC
ncbi:hypothetical protein COLO4_26985 [Corchorus olitorius]|uniref:non-specific serine/threonine protein kinase n=1 Tax=Corchorus olitorius TaxID=93759 RepID=A0A1R3HTV9_9ROSI|nr:hypothetical protein COLO4_26985 [Corchorus olitorius]